MQIVKGQRWMSTAEPELGLGLVLESDRRQVRLFFPASDETRVYALDSAPIERVIFKIGDKIRTQDGRELVITQSETREGLHYYGDGSAKTSEADLANSINLATADRRLLDGRTDPSVLFVLRRSAWEYRSRIQQHPAHGYLGARMDLIPHQIYIAHEVAEHRAPRVLLSDEVGLGKTIEACLILHRLYVRGQSGRVLILVPEPLIHQWFVELYRRFNLTCAIFDEERCAAIQAGHGSGRLSNPFLDEHLVLTSTTLFAKHPERLQEALSADWGLVIVDEAHHLKWSRIPEEVSPEYRMVEALGKISPGLLLLTGTPEQFGIEGHFARLHLLDPKRFHDLDSFRKESENYRAIAAVVDPLVRGKAPGPKDRKQIEKLFPGRKDIPAQLAQIGGEGAPGDAAREVLIDDLLDRHGIGRAVYRNTRAAIPGFPKRKVHAAALSLPESDPDAADKVQAEIGFELGLTDKLPRKPVEKDPRVEWLVKLLKKHPEEKFLLICRYQKRAEQLFEAVQARINISMTVFHEEQTIIQRDRNAAWFSQPAPDGARLLICSEIGSEGRNFQFAHHLVLYDLPADPELLEQRIGRLDRIGQRETIHLHVPFFKGGGGEALFRWFHEGIDAFSHPIQGGSLYLEKFLPRLRHWLEEETFSPRELDQLISDTVDFRKELQKKFESGRDRLLEWHSCRPDKIAPLIGEIRRVDESPELGDFLIAAMDHFGIHVEKLGGRESPGGKGLRSWVLTPGHLMTDQLTLIPPEGKTVTLDRKVALDRDDVEFMTWDHPLAVSVMDLLLGSESGNAAFSEIKTSAGLPAGLYLEMIHLLEGSCPARHDLGRFLPVTPLRVLLDTRGKICPPEMVSALDAAAPADAPRHALSGQSEALKPILTQWKNLAEEKAGIRVEEIRSLAQRTMAQTLGRELERVRSLQKSNGASGEKEIALLQEEQAALEKSIQESRLRLDALRLIRVS